MCKKPFRLKARVFNKICKEHIISLLAGIITFIESVAYIVEQFKSGTDGQITLTPGRIGIVFLYFSCAVFAAIALAYSLFIIINEYRKETGRVFLESDKDGIAQYLKQFIKSGESVAILTHDMSWMTEENKFMLQEKARKKELLLLLPHETEEIKALKALGADVRCFGSLLSDSANPLVKSRMTIINWNKAFPKLTYPVKKDGLHINNEIESGEPANQLALDLIQLLIATSSAKKETLNMNAIGIMLNNYIQSNSEDEYNALSSINRTKIQNWYEKYATKPFESKNVLNLMAMLYYNEDIDFNINGDFIRKRDWVCELYQIPKDKFLDFYMDFRKVITES